MSVFQIIMVVLAVGLIGSTFWGSLLNWLRSMQAVKIPVVDEPNWIDDIAEDTVSNKTELLMIVASWDNLKQLCESAGLDQAVEELTMIWPLLVEVEGEDKNVQIN